MLRGEGGATRKMVDMGLEWLKNHQDPEGYWDCDGFDYRCIDGTCTGKGMALNDPGITGLSLLAFLGAERALKAQLPLLILPLRGVSGAAG